MSRRIRIPTTTIVAGNEVLDEAADRAETAAVMSAKLKTSLSRAQAKKNPPRRRTAAKQTITATAQIVGVPARTYRPRRLAEVMARIEEKGYLAHLDGKHGTLQHDPDWEQLWLAVTRMEARVDLALGESEARHAKA